MFSLIFHFLPFLPHDRLLTLQLLEIEKKWGAQGKDKIFLTQLNCLNRLIIFAAFNHKCPLYGGHLCVDSPEWLPPGPCEVSPSVKHRSLPWETWIASSLPHSAPTGVAA